MKAITTLGNDGSVRFHEALGWIAQSLFTLEGGAAAASRLLAGLLYGVTPSDPLVFVTVPVLLTAVALIASFIPAMRAARVDPLVALRAE